MRKKMEKKAKMKIVWEYYVLTNIYDQEKIWSAYERSSAPVYQLLQYAFDRQEAELLCYLMNPTCLLMISICSSFF